MKASAHFPKSAPRSRNTFFADFGKWALASFLIFSAAFRFEVPGSNLRLALQELQIGGTGGA
jgi:hypothetical protein